MNSVSSSPIFFCLFVSLLLSLSLIAEDADAWSWPSKTASVCKGSCRNSCSCTWTALDWCGTGEYDCGVLCCKKAPAGFAANKRCPCPCGSGKYAATKGRSSCSTCAAGTWSGSGPQTGCTKCGTGRYGTASGRGSESSACPTLCPAGSKRTTATGCSSYACACQTCPAGQYSTTSRAASCSLCSAGRYGTGTGRSSEAAACPSVCQPGYKKTTATGCTALSCACSSCPSGTYSSATLSASCTAVPAGYRANSASRATGIVICPLHHYSTGSATSCTACAAGRETLQAGSKSESSCVPCGAGERGLGAGLGCGACPRGTFNPVAQVVTSCEPAQPGHYVPGTGATEQLPAGQGFYVSGSGQSSRTACPAGHTTPTGTSTGSESCFACPRGAYLFIDPVNRVCRRCPHSESTAGEASVGKNSCRPCREVSAPGCTVSVSLTGMTPTRTDTWSASPPRTATLSSSHPTLSRTVSQSANTQSASSNFSVSVSTSASLNTPTASPNKTWSVSGSSSVSMNTATDSPKYTRSTRSDSLSRSDPTDSESRHRISNTSSWSDSGTDSVSRPSQSESLSHGGWNTSSASESLSASEATQSWTMPKNTSSASVSETDPTLSEGGGGGGRGGGTRSPSLSETRETPSGASAGTASTRSELEHSNASVSAHTDSLTKSEPQTLSESQTIAVPPFPVMGLDAQTQEAISQSTQVLSTVISAAAAPAAMSMLRGAAVLALVGCPAVNPVDGHKWRHSMVPFPASLIPGVKAGKDDGAFSRASIISFVVMFVVIFLFGVITSEVTGGGGGGSGGKSLDKLDELRREQERRGEKRRKELGEKRREDNERAKKNNRKKNSSSSSSSSSSHRNVGDDDLDAALLVAPRHKEDSGEEKKEEEEKKKAKSPGRTPMLVYIVVNGSIGIFAPQAGILMSTFEPGDIALALLPLLAVFALHIFMSVKLVRSIKSDSGIFFAPSKILDKSRGAVVQKHGLRSARCVMESRPGRFCLLGERFWTRQRGEAGQDAQKLLTQLGGQLQRFRGPETDIDFISTANPFWEEIERRATLDQRVLQDFENIEPPTLVRLPSTVSAHVSPHFLLIAWFFSASVGMLQGLGLAHPIFCPHAARIIAGLNVASLFFSLWLRPFVIPLRNWLLCTIDAIVAGSSLAAAILLVTADPENTSLMKLATALQLIVTIFGASVGALMISISATRLAYLLAPCLGGRVATHEEVWAASQYFMSRVSDEIQLSSSSSSSQSTSHFSIRSSSKESPSSAGRPTSGRGSSKRSFGTVAAASASASSLERHNSGGASGSLAKALSSGDYSTHSISHLVDDDNAFLHEMLLRDEEEKEAQRQRAKEKERERSRRAEAQMRLRERNGGELSPLMMPMTTSSPVLSPLSSPRSALGGLSSPLSPPQGRSSPVARKSVSLARLEEAEAAAAAAPTATPAILSNDDNNVSKRISSPKHASQIRRGM